MPRLSVASREPAWDGQRLRRLDPRPARPGLPRDRRLDPLRELRSDAVYVAALLRSIEGPVVMVGHSYGGAVISNAAIGNDQVQALVYINGWVPDEGESLIDSRS
jgi:pimeloyl-ACP methyl ester carboxylesterase